MQFIITIIIAINKLSVINLLKALPEGVSDAVEKPRRAVRRGVLRTADTRMTGSCIMHKILTDSAEYGQNSNRIPSTVNKQIFRLRAYASKVILAHGLHLDAQN